MLLNISIAIRVWMIWAADKHISTTKNPSTIPCRIVFSARWTNIMKAREVKPYECFLNCFRRLSHQLCNVLRPKTLTAVFDKFLDISYFPSKVWILRRTILSRRSFPLKSVIRNLIAFECFPTRFGVLFTMRHCLTPFIVN